MVLSPMLLCSDPVTPTAPYSPPSLLSKQSQPCCRGEQPSSSCLLDMNVKSGSNLQNTNHRTQREIAGLSSPPTSSQLALCLVLTYVSSLPWDSFLSVQWSLPVSDKRILS